MEDELRLWQLAAAEFGANYKCKATVTCYEDRCGYITLFELSHEDDPSNVVKWRMNGYRCHPKQRRAGIFEGMYEQLPIVRRLRSRL